MTDYLCLDDALPAFTYTVHVCTCKLYPELAGIVYRSSSSGINSDIFREQVFRGA